MSDLHDLCKFASRPIGKEYVEQLKYYLKSGIPATYTIEESYNYMNGIEDVEPTTTTTPLHIICQHIPKNSTQEEWEVINEMVQILFEYGAGWSFTDINNETPGCILIQRGFKDYEVYNQIVNAGVRAELLLRKVNDNIEFIDEEEDEEEEIPDLVEQEDKITQKDEDKKLEGDETQKETPQQHGKQNQEEQEGSSEITHDPAEHQDTYLNTKLQYKDDALVTTNKDGVMMSWETELMKIGCESLFNSKPMADYEDDEKDVNILNIGFGMGIIDTMINDKNPTRHYICEPHPDVLKKLKNDGWYEKHNVTILEGRWQDCLPNLLSQGVFFDGIYYDTYSEHYSDMLELFDFIVGLLKPTGIFSFFNGLGADRQIIYEVYKKLLEIDLENYGLQITFTDIALPDLNVWDDIKRSYWNCPVYYHPEVKFIDYQ